MTDIKQDKPAEKAKDAATKNSSGKASPANGGDTKTAPVAPKWHQIKVGGSPQRFAVVAGILFVMTAAAAISHGYFANRWDKRGGLQEVGQVITNMSQESLPNWRFRESGEISDSVLEMLRTTGHASFQYEYSGNPPRGNGGPTRITAAVFVGSPGRITAHDPQVCYSAIDFQGTGTRRKIEFTDADGVKQEFWTMAVSRKDDPGHRLIVSHAWGTDGTSTAADYPRIAYMGLPYLYKIQLAMPAFKGQKLDDNLSIEFLKEFLPLLRRTIQQTQSAS